MFGRFHTIALCITSRETEDDYAYFIKYYYIECYKVIYRKNAFREIPFSLTNITLSNGILSFLQFLKPQIIL